MHKPLAQAVTGNERGELVIEGDWYNSPLPGNIVLDEMSYPDTSYSFRNFFSERPVGFRLGYASGNYGHGIFTTGKEGEISIGKFVVLQCTRIVCNKSVIIGDHCMFSWGSVITDSWVSLPDVAAAGRRKILEAASRDKNRYPECTGPQPVVIEENVWVGFEAVILPGVRIGRGAVIGCKTIVSEDVPPYAVVIGNPGKLIRYLDPNDSEERKQESLNQFIPAPVH
jgi:acetyltransferase-like isoleucine patch superfamily enzyme